MPRINPGRNAYAPPVPRRRRAKRPASRPRSTAPPPPAARDYPSRTPAPAPTPHRAPAFRPVSQQGAPFARQQQDAARRARQHRPRRSPRHATLPEFRLPPTTHAEQERAPAFRPLRSAYRPFQVQRNRQVQRTRAGLDRLPAHPAIPEIPLPPALTHPRGLPGAPRQISLGDLYSREQIHAIRQAYKAAARKIGGRSIHDLYMAGNLQQRSHMRLVGQIVNAVEAGQAERVAHLTGIQPGRDTVKAASGPGHVAAAGPGAVVGNLLHRATQFAEEHTRLPNSTNVSLTDFPNIGVQLARATIEDPKAVASSSLRTGIESLAGIPMGFKELVSDPKHAVHQIAKDYERRYGSIFTNPAEFRRRVKEESGLTPFVLDAASLGVPIGRAATVLARSGAAGRAVLALARVADRNGHVRPLADFTRTAHKAARAPRDARRLGQLRTQLADAEREGDTAAQKSLRARIRRAEANVRSTERPALRFSGGEGGVRKQPSSPNLIIGLGQRGIDRSRRRAFEKEATRAGWVLGPGGRLISPRNIEQQLHERVQEIERQLARSTPGTDEYAHLADEASQLYAQLDQARRAQLSPHRIGALRPGDREVTPKTTGLAGRSLRELPGLRRYTGRVARDLGGEQSITRIRLLTHRGRVLNRVNKALGRLDDDEKASVKYMLQLGVNPDQAGVRALENRRAQILAARAEHGTRLHPILTDTNDELRLIDRILAAPDRHLTPRAREISDELRGIQLEEARRDPELTGEQEVIRRMSPQGKLVGVERGPDTEFFRDVLGRIENEFVDEHGRPLAPGLAGHADELAELHPSERAARASELTRAMRRQRKQAERDVETARRRLAAAKAAVKEAERRGQPIDTEGVREARRALARAKRARARIGRTLPPAERRLGTLLGRLGERERSGRPLATPERAEAREAVSAAHSRISTLERQAARLRTGKRLKRVEYRLSDGPVTAGVRLERRADGESELVYGPNGVIEVNTRTGRGTVGGTPESKAGARRLESFQARDELPRARQALRDAQQQLALAETGAPRITPEQFRSRIEATGQMTGRHEQLAEAERQVQAARAVLDDELAAAPRVSEAQARRVAAREREVAARRETLGHIRNFEAGLKAVYRASKSKRTMRLEDAESFAAKVREAAEAEGLTAPAYWWSSLAPKDMPSLAAAGQGTKAAHRNRAYTGKLFEVGAEEHSTDVFTRGIERNIKRRFQQALVRRNLDTHAYEWSRGHNGEGLTVPQIEKMLTDRGIDPRSIELVEPRLVGRRETAQEGVERGSTLTPEELDAIDAEDFITTTQQDLAEGMRRWEEVAKWDMKQQALHRFLVVPRDVAETVNGLANRMDNKFWRGMEIVLKQKPARILLGAANIPWLSFQIASNALLTGFGGGVNPFNVYAAHKWWKGLTPDEREAVEAELGITHGHHFGLDEPYLGATTSRYVNFWRAYKKSRAGRIGHKVNPLNVFFRLDEAQNNFFRRVLFYDKARKAAYRRMGQSWKGIDRGITRLMDRVLARPPDQAIAAIARHGAEFEAVAKHVNNFLGDYLRFTPAERFLLQRNVMFYGYLRFSLRFTFYTMPVAHPIMANILGNIGRMGADEIKDLMGVPDDYRLPVSILTQTYFGDRRDAKHNELRSLPLGRFNPFLNALTQLDGMQQAVGLVSPFYQILADQAFEESSFTGRDWRIEGRPTPSESDRPANYYGSAFSMLDPTAPRGRIALAEAARLFFPYRVATATGIPGVVNPLAPNQSDDALLGSPRPMMYADPGAAAGVRKSRRDYAAEGFGRHLAQQLLPVFPRRTSSPAVITRELERQAAIAARNRRKPGQRKPRRRKANRYGSGGSSGYGGSRTGSRYG